MKRVYLHLVYCPQFQTPGRSPEPYTIHHVFLGGIPWSYGLHYKPTPTLATHTLLHSLTTPECPPDRPHHWLSLLLEKPLEAIIRTVTSRASHPANPGLGNKNHWGIWIQSWIDEERNGYCIKFPRHKKLKNKLLCTTIIRAGRTEYDTTHTYKYVSIFTLNIFKTSIARE